MTEDTIVEIFKHYMLEPILSIEEVKSGVSKITTTNKKKYIITKASIDSIKNQHEVLSKLKQINVPVAPILETMNGMYYVEIKEVYYCLYPFIDGECIKNLYVKDGEDIVSSYGTSIAILHRGLEQLGLGEDFSSDFFMKKIFNEGLNFIRIYEGKSKVSTLENIILECKSFGSKYKGLPIQMIHGDLHTGNIIYGDNKVNAFIDFESCTTGYRIYDLAYLMVDILMQGFQETGNSYWLKLCRSLVKSYDKELPLLQSEYEAIWYCLLFSQFFITGYLYSIKVFDKAKKHLEGFLWIYKNKNDIYEALIK